MQQYENVETHATTEVAQAHSCDHLIMPPRVIASTSRARSTSSSLRRPSSSTTVRRSLSFGHGLLHDFGGLFVADIGVQGGGYGGRRQGIGAATLDVGFQARNAAVGEKPADLGQQPQRLEQVAGDHRQHDVELEVPRRSAEGDGGVVADYLSHYLGHGLGDDRVYLPRHDRAPGLQVGDAYLG